jgi:hypothetical protein
VCVKVGDEHVVTPVAGDVGGGGDLEGAAGDAEAAEVVEDVE